MQLSPTERDPVQVADWAELLLLYSGKSQLSLEVVRSQIDIDATLLDEGRESGEPELLPHELSESLVAAMAVEIERRASIASKVYPFEKAEGLLHLRPDFISYVPYIFCLLVADRDFYRPGGLEPKLFEHLVCEALRAYLGGEAVRFGEPRDTMPAGIKDAIEALSRLTHDEQVGVYPINATDRDLGVDVFGWKNFPDNYLNKIEVLMQCATGENWTSKEECNLKDWDGILYCCSDRLKGLAIPYVLPAGDEWKRKTSGLIFMDRLRIACVLRDRGLSNNGHMWSEWCEKRITEVLSGS